MAVVTLTIRVVPLIISIPTDMHERNGVPVEQQTDRGRVIIMPALADDVVSLRLFPSGTVVAMALACAHGHIIPITIHILWTSTMAPLISWFARKASHMRSSWVSFDLCTKFRAGSRKSWLPRVTLMAFRSTRFSSQGAADIAADS